jgi:heterodisulfide reductase subunit A
LANLYDGSGNFLIQIILQFRRKKAMAKDVIGSVMVVGGGIAGMQAAIDLADSGYYVYLVEKGSSIGGRMSQLDKTFPTNDCAM